MSNNLGNTNFSKNDLYVPMSVGDWVLTMFITAVPVLGFIMLLVWAFSNDGKTSRKNWAKTILFLILLVPGLFILLISSNTR